MRKTRWLATLVVAGLALVLSGTAQAQEPDFDLLVFTGRGGTPPPVAGNAVRTIRELADANNFNVVVTDRPEEFEKNRLQRYEAMLFLNTGAAQLGPAHEQAIEEWFHAGGGFMGLGSAIETEPEWGFLTGVLGARAASRTDNALGTIKVADRVHDASKDLPEYWNWTDRWYNFDTNVRGVSHVLMTVVEEPFAKQPDYRVLNAIDGTMGADHPVAWCKDYQGGRSFYTALGSSQASFSDSNFKKHLYGALRWTAGIADPVYSDCGATVLANYQMNFVAAPPNLSEPIGFDVLPDGTGRVIQTDRRGGVRLHDPATNSTTVLATIPVYIANEDGMYGPEVDNNFNTNKWVYLFYSPPTVENVKQSDGSTATITTPLNDPTTPQNEQNAPNFACVANRMGSVRRLLPAVALQVRRGDRDDAGPPRSRQRAADPPRRQQPRRLLPRCRRHRLRLEQQPVDGHGRRHARRRRQLRRLQPVQRPAHERGAAGERHGRDGRHVHAHVRRRDHCADSVPARQHRHRVGAGGACRPHRRGGDRERGNQPSGELRR